MKTKSTLVLWLCLLALTGAAQNQITTPSGQPLVIGNQGVKLSNLNSSSATQPTNGKVLSVDANGLIFLAPDASGAPSQFTNSGPNIYFNTGNVGLGTDTPVQRLDVNGSINIPTGNGLRINNKTFLTRTSSRTLLLGLNAGPNASGADNFFLGDSSGYATTTGNLNIFIGNNAGRANTSGIGNIFLGTFSGRKSNASNNMFIGYAVGADNTEGANNTFVGAASGRKNTSGGQNTYIGHQTGFTGSTGERNTFIGANSGYYSTGNLNTAIGYNVNIPAGISNATAIGANASVVASNSIVLGGSGVNVGVGNSSPTARLHITGGNTVSTGVRFEGLPISTGTIYGLYIDANGNLMRSSTASAREASADIDLSWTLTTDEHLINNNSGGVIIGTGLNTTPQGYKLYVSEGILTERVKVAVKSTADWRDNVLQDNYQLRTVEEVEAFIKQNRHLPGVPSAQEMVEKGNDLQRTDAILLEKVEEMMLYIIELKKQNEALKVRMNTLENKR